MDARRNELVRGRWAAILVQVSADLAVRVTAGPPRRA